VKVDSKLLADRQKLPLKHKIGMSKRRIEAWYKHWKGQVYISFSGGKDSTALLHLVRSIYSDVPAVFVDTGLEFPEIRDFVKSTPNVIWLKPKMGFKQVIKKYGYPVVSKENAQKIHEIRTTKSDVLRDKRLNGDMLGYGKLPEKWKFLIDAPFKVSHQCCDALKKSPFRTYERKSGRKAYIGTMASDSSGRKTSYLRRGCNSFESKRPISNPMSFWVDKDVWRYLKGNDIPYSPIYDMGYTRTGCIFCAFGVQRESYPNKFQRLEQTHPAQWRYCMDKLGMREVLEFIGVETETDLFE